MYPIFEWARSTLIFEALFVPMPCFALHLHAAISLFPQVLPGQNFHQARVDCRDFTSCDYLIAPQCILFLRGVQEAHLFGIFGCFLCLCLALHFIFMLPYLCSPRAYQDKTFTRLAWTAGNSDNFQCTCAGHISLEDILRQNRTSMSVSRCGVEHQMPQVVEWQDWEVTAVMDVTSRHSKRVHLGIRHTTWINYLTAVLMTSPCSLSVNLFLLHAQCLQYARSD